MVTGIILAGGTSHRMGQDKALVLLHGRPLICHVVEALKKACDRILIVAQKQQDLSFSGIPVVHDIIPGFGALMGIYTGLKNAGTKYILVAACDMPFIQPSVLRCLTTRAGDVDLVVPRINGYLEPLLAVYSKRCIGPIEKMIRCSEKCIYDFFSEVNVLEIQQKELQLLDPECRSFINLNTPHELDKAAGISNEKNHITV